MQSKAKEQGRGKSFLSVLSDVLLIILIIVAIIITVMTFTSTNSGDGVGNILGYTPYSVMSDSMKPTIEEGDLIVIKQVDADELKVRDVITFLTYNSDGEQITNTHRITGIEVVNGIKSFRTAGDFYSTMGLEDSESIFEDDILGRWTNFRIPSFGKALEFLQTQIGFMVCIIIPLALFFIWQIYKLIAMFIDAKKEQIHDELTAATEEEKRKAVEEYIAQQKEKEKEDSQSDDE